MQIIAAFKYGDGPLMGILSIVFCGLGGFIIGWIHAKKWNIVGIMKLWSVLIVASIIVQILFMVLVAPKLMEGMEGMEVVPSAY